MDLARVRRRRPPGGARLHFRPCRRAGRRQALRVPARRRRGARRKRKKAYGLDHPRSGEPVLLAEAEAWFTYYYWLDDARAPDFARLIDIHRKPGYDPAELFFDPAHPGAAKRRAGVALLRKKLGMRYLMNVVGLDQGARAVRGSHGLLPADPADAPVLLCSDPSAARERFEATEVKDLLLRLGLESLSS